MGDSIDVTDGYEVRTLRLDPNTQPLYLGDEPYSLRILTPFAQVIKTLRLGCSTSWLESVYFALLRAQGHYRTRA
eukprot:2445459-Pleurochrysis_carterae.AAC.1